MKTKFTRLVVMLSACLLASPTYFAQESEIPIPPDPDLNPYSGVLFGLTATGGVRDAGTLYAYNIHSGKHKKLLDFEPRETGSEPQGKLLLSDDCLLFGTTRLGGLNNQGVLFSFDPVGEKFDLRHDFHAHQGSYPEGNMIQSKEGRIYGVTQRGGIFDKGTIFEFDPKKDAYKKMHDFKGAAGIYPTGGLVLAKDGMVYGYTATGGDFNGGCIYRFLPDPAGFKVEDVYHFEQIPLGRTGYKPVGQLVEASNGLLYGVNSKGGAFGKGTLFVLDPKKESIRVLAHFGTKALGSYPAAGLSVLTNGWLCGSTTKGGNFEDGVLFVFDPDREFFVFQFDMQKDKFGSSPSSSLLLASDGYLYGLANNPSKENESSQLFKISPKGLVEFATLVKFTQLNGKSPSGDLVEYRKCITSDEKQEVSRARIAPNPSNGEASLILSGPPEVVRIVLRTPYGKTITDGIFSSNKQININAKGAVGVVFVYIEHSNGHTEVLHWIVH